MKKLLTLAATLAMIIAMPAKLISYDDSHFLRDEYRWFVSTQLELENTQREFNNKQKKVRRPRSIKKQHLSVYGEYHTCEHHNIIAKVSGAKHEDWAGNENTGVDEIELGWQHHLWGDNCDDRHVWGHVAAIIPGGERNITYRSGRQGLEAGLRFFTDFTCYNKGYFDALVGYRWYSGYRSDLMFWNLRLGYELMRCVQLHLTSDFDYGMYNGSSNTIDGRRLHSAYRRLRIGGDIEFKVWKHLSLLAGGFSNIWGQDTTNGGGFRFGIWSRF